MQNWHPLEALSNFMEAVVVYGMNSGDLFKANDLLKRERDTVRLSLLALAGKATSKGLQSGVNIGTRYSQKQVQNFDDAIMRTGQHVIRLHMGTNKGASLSGMMAEGKTAQEPYPATHGLLNHQLAIGLPGPGNTSMIPGWGPASVSADGLHTGRQSEQPGLWPGPTVMTPSTAHKAQQAMELQSQLVTTQVQGRPWSRQATEGSFAGNSPHHHPIWDLGFSWVFMLFFYVFTCFQLRVCEARPTYMWGGSPSQGTAR